MVDKYRIWHSSKASQVQGTKEAYLDAGDDFGRTHPNTRRAVRLRPPIGRKIRARTVAAP
jgi:hypothetical protein